jgi:hypothetical protein
MRLEKRTTAPLRAAAGARRRGAVHAAGQQRCWWLWAGAPVADLRPAASRAASARLCAQRDADPRHAADPHRPGRGGGLPARLFNIGAEGQLYAGALAAVAVGGLHGGTGFELPGLAAVSADDAPPRWPGALLLLGPALMKARLGVDEVVTTLLLNFIVLLGVSRCSTGR